MVLEKVMATNEMIKCSNLKKKKEKNKNQGDQGKGIKQGVSVFKIDSRTIKGENLWLSGYRVPLGDMILAYAFRKLVC